MQNTRNKKPHGKPLAHANYLVRERKYAEALPVYEMALSHYPSLYKSILQSIDFAKRKATELGQDIKSQKPKIKKPENLEEHIFEKIENSGLFNPVWYLSEYGEKYEITDNPLAHYLEFGMNNRLNPSIHFDTDYYLRSNPDVASDGINPFIHYITQGHNENRSPLPPPPSDYESKYSVAEPQYIPRLSADIEPVDKAVRVIAFYLPQFHSIPENDKWWGKGFTEWSNVKPAESQFEGHYQPHLPDDSLAYYNLLDGTTQGKQVDLAKQYGIEGFCFYLYWFTGHKLLQQPVENYLADPSLDLPFCVCWANENWSRRWDGLDQDLLIEQHYSEKDDIEFIVDAAKYLRDPRYIRINGKPVLLVYRPSLFPDIKSTAARWRTWCSNNGLGEIYLIYPQSFETVDPAEYGFDAACEFPPNNSSPPNITNKFVPLVKDFKSTVYDWRVFLNRSEKYTDPSYTLFRSANPSWDNTARKKNKGTVFQNSCPKLFEKWLTNAFVHTLQQKTSNDEKIIFINAWNEWAEGAHLEPDQRYGYAWLQAVRDAHKTALLGNARHPTILETRWNKLEKIFGCMPDRKTHGFLVDYEALFRKAVQNGAVFSFKENLLTCTYRNKEHTLESREALSKLSLELYPDGSYCFVILQHNKSDLTIKCVKSIKQLNNYGQKLHIIIVDNGSSFEHVESIKNIYQNDQSITLVFLETNLGFSGGNNVGYRQAKNIEKAKYCVVLNNDTEITQIDFVKRTIDLYLQNSYSILGPDVIINDGRRENPWNDYVYEIEDFKCLKETRAREKKAYLDGANPLFSKIGKSTPEKDLILNPLLQGAAFILSPVFISDNENLFDERLFLYGEEFLLAIECLLSGHLTLYSSYIHVNHLEGATTSSLPDVEKLLHGYDSAIKSMDLCLTRLIQQKRATQGDAINHKYKFVINDLLATGGPHVLIDLLFCQPGYHGGGEYGKAVFQELVTRYSTVGGFSLWVALNPRLHIDQWVWSSCRQYGVNIIEVHSYSDIVDLVNSDHFDSFFTPAIVVYTGYEYMRRVGKNLPFTCEKTRVIGTLHDIRDFELANDKNKILTARKALGCAKETAMSRIDFEHEITNNKADAENLKNMYRAIIGDKVVDQIITISEYCEKSIKENIGTPNKPLKVLMSPMKPRPIPEKPLDLVVDISNNKYALLVHAGREEKNAASAVAAFDQLFDKYGDREPIGNLKVVLTGIKNINQVGLKNIKNPHRFIALAELAPQHFEYVMSKACLLIYPSFNEGLGYPPIEAMSYGVPSVVSNVTAIPEVCGEAAIYFSPYDITSIINAITKALINGLPDNAKILKRYQAIRRKQTKDLDELSKTIIGSLD